VKISQIVGAAKVAEIPGAAKVAVKTKVEAVNVEAAV